MILLIKHLCSKGNTSMQDFMRGQLGHNRSFNLVSKVINFAKMFKDHLHFPIAYKIFLACLECTFEFIQGPNKLNSEIVVKNDFIEFADIMLRLGYYKDNRFEVIAKIVQNEKNELEYLMEIGRTYEDFKKKLYEKAGGANSGQKEDDLDFAVEVVKDKNIITRPPNNYMISLVKYNIMLILYNLLEGYDSSDYVFYLYRRELDPQVLRNVLAQQRYFFIKYYKKEYTKNLFYNYTQDLKCQQPIPYIIEIGFLTYFLLTRIRENVEQDYDERYYKNILCLIPEKQVTKSEDD